MTSFRKLTVFACMAGLMAIMGKPQPASALGVVVAVPTALVAPKPAPVATPAPAAAAVKPVTQPVTAAPIITPVTPAQAAAPATPVTTSVSQQTKVDLSKFETCFNDYVDGKYECAQYANDFVKEANKLKIKACKYTIGFNNPLDVVCNMGHAMNIVQVADANSVNPKFCAVSPQTNATLGCWYQAGGSPVVPPSIQDIVFNKLDKACYAQYKASTFIYTSVSNCNF